MSEAIFTPHAPDEGSLRDIADAIYKLGLVAAELGLTGQESGEELAAAVRKLKARANSNPNNPHHGTR